MADELKPCPFCGGEAEWRSGGPGCAWVSCKDCPVETGDGNVPRIAAAWNRRTPDLAAALIASEAARKLAEERLARAQEGLSALDKAAGEVARNGAVTGPQWTRLTVALLKTRAILKEIDND